MAEAKFEDCELFDARDSESLTSDSPEDEILEVIDMMADPKASVTDAIAAVCPLTVRSFVRKEVSESHKAVLASSLLETLFELFAEDYGNPDDGDLGLSKADEAGLTVLMRGVVDETAKRIRVWACREVASRTYSAEEVEAIARKRSPDWFEEKPA